MRKIFALLFLSAIWHQAPAQVPQPPPTCMVDQFFGNFHSGSTAAGDTVATIWCDDQTGLNWWVMAGTITPTLAPPPCLATAGSPAWSLTYLQALWTACAASAGPMTADQQATATALLHAWLPRLNVTGPANQNVYTVKADGTRGPQLVIGGFGMQIAPGTLCGGKRLLNAGARFADVSSFLSTNGMLLPSGSFALCSITYPPAGGFTN